ncbi:MULTISPECIES: efflux transporter outer membrane subunit [unclassified Pseudomonas]|uniref:efflux transporter outer membrane subunit n=1 Tax=unclassified Pseudomonas TaxID=196821 RepID=UPI0039B74502
MIFIYLQKTRPRTHSKGFARRPDALRTVASMAAVLLLAGCAVGPDYVKPESPDLHDYARQLDTAATSSSQASPQADPKFWRMFDDPMLDRLIDSALVHNHDLRIAFANYQQASALLRGARYDQFPTITADAQAGSARNSADQAPGVSRSDRDHDQYEGNIGFSWELDLFGRVRRSVESQRAETSATANDFAAMQVAVVSELVRTYWQLRGWQSQLRIAQENSANQERTLDLLKLRLDSGTATPFDVDRGQTQLETTRSRIPPLQARVEVATHRIAVLIGEVPRVLADELEIPGELPALPKNFVVAAPSELLRRRPDVAGAERRLAAATARVGVATADLFPRFTFGGLIGAQAFRADALFERDSETRLVSLGVDGSFLNVGRIRARIAAANAATAADLAAYERTVLTAIEETENALVGVNRTEQENAYLQHAAEASVRASDMAKLRFDQGSINVLELLDAENARLLAQDAYIQSRARNTLAIVALYQAVAGGWGDYVPDAKIAGRQ